MKVEYKQRCFLFPQYGAFMDTSFDEDAPLFKINRMQGWLDWHLSWFGWQIGVWIERVDDGNLISPAGK